MQFVMQICIFALHNQPSMKVGVTFLLDTRRELKEGGKGGVFPIKLQVIYKRQSRVYKTGFACTKQDFERVLAPRPRDEFKMLKLQLSEIERKAIAIVNELRDNFSFEAFKERMYPKQVFHKNLVSYFEEYIQQLRAENSIKTALTYQNSLNSLLKFKRGLDFKDITPQFLKRYEIHELQKGNSPTSVSIYLRCLKAIVNLAIRNGDFELSKYPFGKNGYAVPKVNNIKKALTENELKALIAYSPQSENEAFVKDMFLFSFYCNGINFKDVALLKWQNIEGDKVTFVRAKTSKTRTAGKPITLYLNSRAKEILCKYANTDKTAENYVFPFFEPHLTAEKQVYRLIQIISKINKNLKVIASKLDFQKNLTTYVARHTFATLLKRKGLPTALISEGLGHSSVKITENYLDSFGNEVWQEIAKQLESL